MIFADGPRAGELVAIARRFISANDPEGIILPSAEVVAYEFRSLADGDLHWETGPAEMLRAYKLEAVQAHLYRRSDTDGRYYLADGCVEILPGFWAIEAS